MKSKLTAIEAKKDELDSAIRGIQGQMRALVEKHGHDDLSVIYNDSQRRLMDLREKVRSTQMKLESAMAGAPKDGDKNADPTKGITIEMIAQIDVTMRQYIQTLEAMEFQLQRLARTVGTKNPAYTQAAADVELQKQRINTYAEAFRKNFTGQDIFNPDTMQVMPLTKGMLVQLERQAGELEKQYEKDQADFQVLSQDWSKIIDLKTQLERHRTDLDKYTKQYEEQVAQAAMGGTLQVVSDGDTPIPGNDKRKQFAFIGFVGGAGLPVGLLLLIGLLDGRMRYSEEAGADMSGMTLLGILPNLPDRLTDPAQAATAAHCVHQIRTMLQINSGEEILLLSFRY